MDSEQQPTATFGDPRDGPQVNGTQDSTKGDSEGHNDALWTQESIKRHKRGTCGSTEERSQRKRIRVQEVSKKGSKSEPIKKMKIELSLRPELNPAHQKTSKSRFKTRLSGMLLEMNRKLCPRTLQRSKGAHRWSQKGPGTAMEEPRQHEASSPRLGIYM